MVFDIYVAGTVLRYNIKLMNLKFWNINGEETIEPPARDKSKGRKKNPAKRMKSVHESPTKGKNRLYVIGITLFRQLTDETSLRK